MDFAFAIGELRIATAHFPVRGPTGVVSTVLALEAGESFTAPRADLRRALLIGVALSLLGAVALGALALQWVRGEEQRRRAAAQLAQGDALTRMAAMAAHEIRNPVGVIRGAVELVRARSGGDRRRPVSTESNSAGLSAAVPPLLTLPCQP